jgi:hypothetical protein
LQLLVPRVFTIWSRRFHKTKLPHCVWLWTIKLFSPSARYISMKCPKNTPLWLETHSCDWTLCIKHQKLLVESLLMNPINLHHVAKNWHLTAKKKSKTSSLVELAIGSIDRTQCCLELQLTQKKKKGKNPGSGRNKQTHHTLTVGKLVGTPDERNSISNLEKISCRSTGRSVASKDQLHQKCAQKCAKLLDKASWI